MTSQMNDENGFMMCRVDPDRQSVDGRIHHSLLGGLAMGKLQVGTSTEGQHDQLLGELDFGQFFFCLQAPAKPPEVLRLGRAHGSTAHRLACAGSVNRSS